MKAKLILCLALILGGFYSAFALAYFVQLKPADMKLYPNIIIQSQQDGRRRDFSVILLPQKNFPNSNTRGSLAIYDQTNHLGSLVDCEVNGIMLSYSLKPSWDNISENEYYMAMTNRLHRPLAGAKIFTFQVATNLLTASEFTLWDHGDESYSFCLKDFSDGK